MEVIVIALAIIRMFFSLLGVALSRAIKAIGFLLAMIVRLFRFLFGRGASEDVVDEEPSDS